MDPYRGQRPIEPLPRLPLAGRARVALGLTALLAIVAAIFGATWRAAPPPSPPARPEVVREAFTPGELLRFSKAEAGEMAGRHVVVTGVVCKTSPGWFSFVQGTECDYADLDRVECELTNPDDSLPALGETARYRGKLAERRHHGYPAAGPNYDVVTLIHCERVPR